MLTTTASAVAPKVLKELIAAGSVSAARVEPGDKGLLIVVRAGMYERVLGAARGGLRYFQSLDGAASVLQGYGIEHGALGAQDDGEGLQASSGLDGRRVTVMKKERVN